MRGDDSRGSVAGGRVADRPYVSAIVPAIVGFWRRYATVVHGPFGQLFEVDTVVAGAARWAASDEASQEGWTVTPDPVGVDMGVDDCGPCVLAVRFASWAA